MKHINHVTLKKKALNCMKERRWDILLLRVFREIQTMFAFRKEHDIENGLHVGLVGISEVKKTIECGGKSEEINFFKARIEDIDFMIGESSGNQMSKISTVSLVINDTNCVTATYMNDELYEVEEFHESEEIETVLSRLESGIRKRRLKEVREEYEEREILYKDKFTFKSSD